MLEIHKVASNTNMTFHFGSLGNGDFQQNCPDEWEIIWYFEMLCYLGN